MYLGDLGRLGLRFGDLGRFVCACDESELRRSRNGEAGYTSDTPLHGYTIHPFYFSPLDSPSYPLPNLLPPMVHH